ncbi:MAG: fatty acid--CoA ligase family protein [Myxococcota bacterium]
MNAYAAALGLEVDDATPLVARGASVISRGDVRRRADALSERLESEQLHRVLVQSDDSEQIIAAIQACTTTGADLWIAHTNVPAAFIDEIVAQAGIQLKLEPQGEQTAAAAGGAPGGRAIHMMTSGTTGRPKVAVHSLDSLLARIRANAQLPVNRDARWLLTYQPTGFAGIQVTLTAALSNGLLVVPEARTPAGFFEAAKQHQVTRVSATATFWRSLLMVAKPDDLALEQITLGGEAVDQSILDRLGKSFPEARLTHIYASTEAGVVFAVHDGQAGFPAEWLENPVQSVGLRIREGRLQIKTKNAMSKYTTESSQPITDDGWLATADECEIRGDRVIILGRKDSTINVAGSKVYPLAVESFLLGLEDVVEARVFGVENPVAGAIVGAEVVLTAGLDAREAKKRILKACRAGMPSYQVPRVLDIVDAIKVHASGKKA